MANPTTIECLKYLQAKGQTEAERQTFFDNAPYVLKAQIISAQRNLKQPEVTFIVKSRNETVEQCREREKMHLKEEIDIMNSYLPLEVETISLWTNVQYVPPHKDKKVYDTRLDFRFRFVIAQEKKSFFIDYEHKKRYIDVPNTTNLFCFNNQSCMHGGSFDESNFKILGVIRGKINDGQKLSDLLENSIQKYSDTCFTKDNYFG